MQGFPIVNYSTDNGLGYGAQVMVVDRADGTWRPYRSQFLVQYYATTADIFLHRLGVDLPQFLGSDWRVGLEVQLSRSKFTPYYGVGNTSEFNPTYTQCADRESLKGSPDTCGDNAEFRGLRYYSYDLQSLPRIHLNLRRRLGGAWLLFLGSRLRFESVRLRYTADELGQTTDSRLMEDVTAGRQPTLSGGGEEVSQRTHELIAGFQYDTRDVEASPTQGMWHELSVRGATRYIGSEFDYWGVTLHGRAWVPVISKETRLVAGFRGIFDAMGGEVPLSLQSLLGGLDSREALGGGSSIRGLLRARYQGPVKLLANAELRWLPLTLQPGGQRFDLGLVAFADAGRVWSDLSFRDPGGFKAGAGAGARVIWNQLFVLRVDAGWGITEPTSGFYVDFGHVF